MSRKIELAIIHCSDTYVNMDWDATDIRRIHVDENGWLDIGYNYIIKRDGTLENGRDLDNDGNVEEEIGAHARGFNHNSIGICLIGGKGADNNPEFNFTSHQMLALERLVCTLQAKYKGLDVIGHRDVSTKACPSFNVKAYFS